jgi:hypothetical protein
MNELDLILLLFYGLICYLVGRWHQTQVLVQRLLANSERIRELLDQVAAEEATTTERIEIRAEWVGDQVYLYVKSTGQFLAQGADVDEAIDRITHFTPGHDYVLPREMATKPQSTQP